MIKLIIIATTTLLIVMIAIGILGENSGLVYIKIRQINIEMSLLLLLLLWVFFTIAVHYVWKTINKLFGLKQDIDTWQHHRNMEQAHIRLSNGFIELGNGNYKKAERLLTSAANKTKYSLVPLIGAANAAQQRGDSATRNFLLNKALEQNLKAKVSLNLTKADYLLSLGNYVESQAILDSLGKKIWQNSLALKIQANLFSRTSQWAKLLPLIPKLYKKTNFSNEEISQLEYQAHRYGLINVNDVASLQSCWQQIPKALQSNKGILIEYVHKLSGVQEYTKAAKQILKYLAKNWDEDLAVIYSELPIKDSAEQIRKLGEWHKIHTKNTRLHLAMAKLYIRKELWVMAQGQLKLSIKVENTLVAQELLHKVQAKIADFELS